jgi:ComEC/Rec2-related protein
VWEGKITNCLSNRRIFVWAALSCAAACFCGLFSNWYCLLLLTTLYAVPLLCAIKRTRSLRRVFLVAALCLPLVSFIYGNWRLPRDQNQLRSFVLSSIVLSATVAKKPQRTAGNGWCFPILARHVLFPVDKAISGPSLVLVAVSGQSDINLSQGAVRAGDDVIVRGKLRKLFSRPTDVDLPHGNLIIYDATCSPAGAVNAGSANGDNAGAVDAAQFECLSGALASSVDLCRTSIRNSHIAAIGDSRGGLLTSMVIGGKAASLPHDIVQTFRNIGLSHILAASGFNLTIVIAMTYWLVRLVFPLGPAANYTSFLTMAIYIALAGPSPSLIRAALMCSLLLLGRLWQRRTAVSATLAAALLVTWLFSPSALSDVGLQLSYAATGGIVLGARHFSDWINRSPSLLAEKTAGAVSLALIAQLAVLPIQAFYFCQAGVLFVVSNLLVVPVVTPVTILGFASSLSALAGVIAPISVPLMETVVRAIDSIVNFPLAYMLAVANFLNTIEMARLRLGRPEMWTIPLYYLCLFVFFISLRRRSNRLPALVLVLVGMIVLAYKPRPPDFSLACFDRATILINADRNAVLQARIAPSFGELDPSQVRIDRFLNFNAVRALSRIAADRVPGGNGRALESPSASVVIPPAVSGLIRGCQNIPSWMGTIFTPTLSGRKLFSGVTLCQDHSGGGNVLIVDGARSMIAANLHSDEILSSMHSGATRLLVYRLDSFPKRRSDLSTGELLDGANKLVEATGIQFIVLIQDRNQMDDLRSLFGRSKFRQKQARSPISLVCPEHVQALLIERAQLNRASERK